MERKTLFKYIIYFVVLLIVTSCSTKKDTTLRRGFHNMTSHYNGYWNARENVEAAVDNMIKSGSDNYLTTLTVNYYGNKKESQSLKSSMDKSIEKAYVMIRRHSMVFGGEEKVKWIDDCYFLIGQCYFYEKDFNNARRIFQYVITTYEKNNIVYDAKLWLAMTYTQNKEFEKAANVLEELQKPVEDLLTSTETRRQFPIAYADYYILQEKNSEAIPYLEQTVLLNKYNRRAKQRANFILGQIHQELENYTEASEYYKNSTKGPDFRITFNSKIRMAQCTDIGNTAKVLRSLQKMLKEGKYAEYKDQIYFALAEIARRNGDTTKLIENLALSVQTSVSNDYQKAMSAQQLADLYFQSKKYIQSQPYYDTTIQFLPQDYPNYVELKEKTAVLDKLVENLKIVQIEDSLQSVAKMDPTIRAAMIDSIIAEIEEQERINKELEMQRQRAYSNSLMTQYENQQTQNRLGTSVSWYFYGSQTVSAGISDFKKKWGDRKYEDLWVFRDKHVLSWDDLGNVDTTSVDTTAMASIVTDPKDPQFYLQNLPLTEEQMEASNKKIEDALYQAGFIAMDQLSDYKLSNECFDQLVVRFPETDHKLTAYIMMYLNCRETSDEACMTQLGAAIQSEYPESDFAHLLRDPSYLVVMTDRLEAADNLYSDTYSAFDDKMYDLVDLFVEEGADLEDKKHMAKFLYLSSLSRLIQNGETDTLAIDQLKTITKDYSGEEVSTLAADLLKYLVPEEEPVLDSVTMAQVAEEKAQQEALKKEVSLYKYVCKANYFYVLLVKSSANVKAISTRVSDYLIRYHKLDQLSSVARLLNDDYEMITVSTFPDCNKAMEFYDNAVINNYIYSGLNPDDYYHFVISQENYPVFYKSKNIEAYLIFFNDKLMTGKDTNP